ncbi:hypothetical protein HDU82_006287 [Entophlyctis luteolus]|nr:hypothetical protein HDU82_006287 [Entophlyctis luteolus]
MDTNEFSNDRSHFDEKDEVLHLIAELASSRSGTRESTEPVLRRIRSILERYQEQPALLDPHLESLTSAAVKPLRIAVDLLSFDENSFALFNVINILCSVRGWKTIIRFLTHEASDLEPVLAYLLKVPSGNMFWEVRYVALLWLSLIVMIPFDINKIDSTFQNDSPQKNGLVETLLSQGKFFLPFTGKEYEGASILLTHPGSRSLAANLVKYSASSANPERPTAVDVSNEDDDEIPEEIEEIIQLMLEGLRNKDTIVRWSAAKGLGRISGRLPQDFATEIVSSVVELFQEDLVSSENLEAVDLSAVSDATWHGACLAIAELARRGLLLPEWLEKVIPWISLALLFDVRRGSHSIGSHVRDAGNYVCWSFFRAYDPTLLVPHIPHLARRLVVSATLDREVNVRRAASAAFQEGVGRLGGSGEYGAISNGIDIVTIADYFSVGNRSHSVLEVSVSVSKYEFYRNDIMLHCAKAMSVHWDKTMRTLASQALHKLTFLDLNFVLSKILPDLIPKAKSPDLIVRHGSCLAIGEICLAWYNIRSAESSNPWWTEKPITRIVPEYPQTFLESFGSDLTRSALCRLISCLSAAHWPSNYTQHFQSVPQSSFDDFIVSWWHIVHSSLENRDESVQADACDAVNALSEYCWPFEGSQNDIIRNSAPLQEIISKRFCQKLILVMATSSEQTTVPAGKVGGRVGSVMIDRFPRRGYALAAGRLSVSVIHAFGETILNSLIDLVRSIEGGGEDAEARRNAVTSIVQLYVTVGPAAVGKVFSEELVSKSIEALFFGMEDYSADSRGDVGAWIREACFRAWPIILPLLFSACQRDGVHYMVPAINARVVKQLVRHSVEKIDRVRETAGIALSAILDLPEDIDLGVSAECRYFVKSAVSNGLNWLNTAEVYPAMVPLLKFDELRHEMLIGLVVSVGGISESLVRYSTSSFVQFVNSLPVESTSANAGLTLQSFLVDFTSLYRELRYIRDRISVSLLETTDVLVGCGVLAKFVSSGSAWHGVASELVDAVKAEAFKSRDANRYMGVAAVPGVSGKPLRNTAMTELVTFLTHPFPRVRRGASESLYIALTTAGEEVLEEYSENIDMIEEILLSTDWDLPAAGLKENRQKLLALLGLKL